MCETSKNKSHLYIKDLRRVFTCEGGVNKRYRYPSNYDDIVKNGDIEERHEGGEERLYLIYGKGKKGSRKKYTLTNIGKYDNDTEALYTLYGLINIPIRDLHKSYYEPFGFTSIELKKYLPVFEIDKTEDSSSRYKLINSRLLTRKGCSVNEVGKVVENDRDEKGRNGKLLYHTKYGYRSNTTFYVIRDEFRKIEVDKSILSLSVVLPANLLKLCCTILFFLPMKLGGYLLSLQNIFAKVFGNIFFTPFMPLKFICNLATILLKIPILLFVSHKEKYGNYYYILWKHELMGCISELRSDLALIKSGKRLDKPNFNIHCKLDGTWKELDMQLKIFEMSLEWNEA